MSTVPSTHDHGHGVDAQAHQALFYRGDREYVDGVLRFLAPGLEAGEPIAVAVPGPRADLLRARLNTLRPDIEMLDMFELGRNPARIIPAVHEMLAKHGGRLLHYVGEPIWPGRSAQEIREATRHEALINLAWPGATIRVLCPYDAEALDPEVLADAARTHPWVINGDGGSISASYSPTVPLTSEGPLAAPPTDAARLPFDVGELWQIRELVARTAASAGLDAARSGDLVLAANEVATNALKHAQAPCRVRTWVAPDAVVCELEDAGHITDPLAGRHAPRPSVDGGLGLWLVNQLCDLVEVRTASGGTTIRLHMNRAA
jgi:anti-sigma regulatory factor (Ser/Thr protein kinase)